MRSMTSSSVRSRAHASKPEPAASLLSIHGTIKSKRMRSDDSRVAADSASSPFLSHLDTEVERQSFAHDGCQFFVVLYDQDGPLGHTDCFGADRRSACNVAHVHQSFEVGISRRCTRGEKSTRLVPKRFTLLHWCKTHRHRLSRELQFFTRIESQALGLAFRLY